MAGLNFWNSLKKLVSNPESFFKNLKSEKGIKNSLLSYTIVSGFFAVFNMFLASFFYLIFQSEFIFGIQSFVVFLVLATIIFLLISVLSTFLYSLFIHIFVLLFGGDGGFVNTYNVYTYSMIPFLFILLIPYIGFFGIFYFVFLMTIGISKLHNLSILRSAFAVLIPGTIIFLTSFIVFFYLLARFVFLF